MNLTRSAESAKFSQKLVSGAPLLVVFLVWGSTFAGIRVALETFAPFSLGAIRMSLAALVLALLAAVQGTLRRPTRQELRALAITGLLYWCAGNGLMILAVARIPSGLVAVLAATMPLFAQLIAVVRGRGRLTPVFVGSTVLGIAGVVAISVPTLGVEQPDIDTVVGIAFALGAAVAWAIGTHVEGGERYPRTAGAAIQFLAASCAFALLSFTFGEELAMPTTRSFAALGYLVLFGSAATFVCYLRALRTMPRPLVMSHAYVNPVVAIAVGVVMFGEPLTRWSLWGGGLVLFAVTIQATPSLWTRLRRRRSLCA